MAAPVVPAALFPPCSRLAPRPARTASLRARAYDVARPPLGTADAPPPTARPRRCSSRGRIRSGVSPQPRGDDVGPEAPSPRLGNGQRGHGATRRRLRGDALGDRGTNVNGRVEGPDRAMPFDVGPPCPPSAVERAGRARAAHRRERRGGSWRGSGNGPAPPSAGECERGARVQPGGELLVARIATRSGQRTPRRAASHAASATTAARPAIGGGIELWRHVQSTPTRRTTVTQCA